VALPAFAAVCRAAARLLLTAGRAAIDRYLLAAGPTAANPQQRRAAAGWDRRTDRRTPDSCINPAPGRANKPVTMHRQSPRPVKIGIVNAPFTPRANSTFLSR